jgi:hypothetical protein
VVGPRLILGRQARLAFLVVPDAAVVSPVDVNLLECSLKVERRFGVSLRKRHFQAWKPLAKPARIELEAVAQRPAAGAAFESRRPEFVAAVIRCRRAPRPTRHIADRSAAGVGSRSPRSTARAPPPTALRAQGMGPFRGRDNPSRGPRSQGRLSLSGVCRVGEFNRMATHVEREARITSIRLRRQGTPRDRA